MIVSTKARQMNRFVIVLFCCFGIHLALAQETPEYHTADCASILKTFVNDAGLVNYKELKSNRRALDRYISRIAELSPDIVEAWAPNDRIAFWINAYNALTLQTIIDRYPIQSSFLASFRFPKNSIRQISGVWDELEHTVLGKRITLDHIEHQILRKEFNQPGIHMALVCASIGCPLLRTEPYSGALLKDQLADQARRFLADSSKFRIDRSSNTVYLSPIFKWFGGDFTAKYSPPKGFGNHRASERASLHYISAHLQDEDREYLESSVYDISYLDYDWSLNEQ